MYRRGPPLLMCTFTPGCGGTAVSRNCRMGGQNNSVGVRQRQSVCAQACDQPCTIAQQVTDGAVSQVRPSCLQRHLQLQMCACGAVASTACTAAQLDLTSRMAMSSQESKG